MITPFFTTDAQVRVGGQIDISIDLPEIIIPRRVPRERVPKRKRPVVIRDRGPVYESTNYSLGSIGNQNNGAWFDYDVINARVIAFSNNELDAVLELHTGDTMIISMQKANYRIIIFIIITDLIVIIILYTVLLLMIGL